MKKIWYSLKLIFNLIRIGIFPQHTNAALGIGENLYALGYVKAVTAKISEDPHSVKVIEERKLLNPFDLHALQKLAPGTLGRSYADHMLSQGLDPDFYKPMNVTNSEVFCMMRLRQTHDLWHVVTGFTTSVPHEIGLQSFYFAQTRASLSPFLIAGSLIGASFKDRSMLLPLFENVVLGWAMALKAKALFAVDWEANWETPLADLRRDLSIMNLNENIL